MAGISAPVKFDRMMVILSAIKNAGPVGITRSDLIAETGDVLGVTANTIGNYAQELCEKGKVQRENLGTNNKDGVRYIFIDPDSDVTKKEEPKTEEAAVSTVTSEDHVDDLNGRFGSGKNDEGYPDPTASAAMGRDRAQTRGEIWSQQTQTGDTHDFLVFASNGTFATGIRLKTVAYELSEDELEHHFESKRGVVYYYDPRRVTTVPTKYLKPTRQSTSKSEYDKVISDVNRYLGFVATEPKTVEVVKEVPVPVEVIKEVEVPVGDSEEIDRLKNQIRILEAKISVYKECIQAFANK